MLEKIGLPPKPSLRGHAWVIDASHCQGCSSQFSFINRKHHCRRCGGIFCNSCTYQRMFLRGQGDSPVRICDPCKKLEEAARFELRSGHKNRAAKGNSKLASNGEDELLNQIMGNEGKESSSSVKRTASGASSSTILEAKSTHGDESDILHSEAGSISPESLRQRALDEKNKYKILKGKGRSEDALKAFKRGKELERQADALEISLRKNRKRSLSSATSGEILNNGGGNESGRKNKLHANVTGEKDEFAAELREMGLSDMDFHEDKKSANVSLEGELFNILGEVSQRNNKSSGIDKTEVIAIKKKALALKREGKLTEAKEELKKAKVLEKQLEEQELLGGSDDSDDELSALINNMDDDKDDIQLGLYDREHNLDIDNLVGISDDVTLDNNFEVTNDDLQDPTMAAALASLGWNDDSDHQNTVSHSAHIDKEALSKEIISLKRDALTKKREGNAPEAVALLKKAKLLERDLESLDYSHADEQSLKSTPAHGGVNAMKGPASKVAPKSRLMIQKELLALKRKALALKREGKLDEAEEELKKGRALEQQLEDIDNGPKVKAAHVSGGGDLAFEHPAISGNLPVDEDVTDQDMHDPAYLSLLKNLGWNDAANESPATQAASDLPARKSRSKAEIQRELLGLKRKSVALRRQGKTDEAEQALQETKALEAEMAEMETPKVTVSNFVEPPLRVAVRKEDDNEDVTEADINDPALLFVLKGFGFEDEEQPPKHVGSEFSVVQSTSSIPVKAKRSKGEIQRELLGLKRKSLAHRRKGDIEEAEEVLKMAKVLEAEMEELEAPSKEVLLDNSLGLDSLINNEENSSLVYAPRVNRESSAETVAKNPVFVTPLLSSAPIESDAGKNLSVTQMAQGTFITTAAQSGNIEDLRTGDRSRNSRLQKLGNKDDLEVVTSSLSMIPNRPASLTSSHEDIRGNDNVTAQRRENIDKVDKGGSTEASSTQGFNLHTDQTSLQQEILARKRKAVKLKREGNLAEAREELKQAKLLEKNLTEDNAQSKPGLTLSSVSTSFITPPVAEKPNVAPKPLSAHDRFKIQQESLSHKRNALKLRREGRVEEAEAEFKMAKNLEAKLDLASQDSAKPSSSGVGDLGVDDFLDPQLLSALQAIGIEDSSMSLPHPAESVNRSASRSGENTTPEITKLEELIKTEKVKAVTLKRSGKQAEALDALRRAKAYEKKHSGLDG